MEQVIPLKRTNQEKPRKMKREWKINTIKEDKTKFKHKMK